MAEQSKVSPDQVGNDDRRAELNFLPPSELNESVWHSLLGNIRAALNPEKLPPLQLTSKPIDDDGLILPRTGLDGSLWRSLTQNVRDVLSPEKLPPLQLTSKPLADNGFDRHTDVEQSLWS
ncbi:MAG TPA: hypothetical protein VII29_17645, partial [Terriglobales bacterium]